MKGVSGVGDDRFQDHITSHYRSCRTLLSGFYITVEDKDSTLHGAGRCAFRSSLRCTALSHIFAVWSVGKELMYCTMPIPVPRLIRRVPREQSVLRNLRDAIECLYTYISQSAQTYKTVGLSLLRSLLLALPLFPLRTPSYTDWIPLLW